MKNFRMLLVLVFFSCVACLTGCSSDENPLIGTWSNSYTDADTDCLESSDLTILEDGTFSIYKASECSGIEGDWEFEAHGIWETANGLLYITLSTSSDTEEMPIHIEIPFFYFITSAGQLAMAGEEEVFERDGSGSGIVGLWDELSEDCPAAITIKTNGTYDYDDCGDSFSGTYQTSSDRLRIFDEDLNDLVNGYYKVFGNYLVIMDGDYLYTKE